MCFLVTIKNLYVTLQGQIISKTETVKTLKDLSIEGEIFFQHIFKMVNIGYFSQTDVDSIPRFATSDGNIIITKFGVHYISVILKSNHEHIKDWHVLMIGKGELAIPLWKQYEEYFGVFYWKYGQR